MSRRQHKRALDRARPWRYVRLYRRLREAYPAVLEWGRPMVSASGKGIHIFFLTGQENLMHPRRKTMSLAIEAACALIGIEWRMRNRRVSAS